MVKVPFDEVGLCRFHFGLFVFPEIDSSLPVREFSYVWRSQGRFHDCREEAKFDEWLRGTGGSNGKVPFWNDTGAGKRKFYK